MDFLCFLVWAIDYYDYPFTLVPLYQVIDGSSHGNLSSVKIMKLILINETTKPDHFFTLQYLYKKAA